MLTKITFFAIGVVMTASLFLFLPTAIKDDSQPNIPEEDSIVSSLNAEVIYFDTDNDGESESILLYSCQGCNAPPRELAIIDDGKLVFFYEGGELEFASTESGGFTINETNVPRNGARIETRYLHNELSNKYKIADD